MILDWGPSTLLGQASPSAASSPLPLNEGMLLSVTMCICPLSRTRGCEHVLGPLPGSLHQWLLAAGELPWVTGGSRREQQGLREAGADRRGEEGRLEAGCSQVSISRPVVQPCTELVGRTCMQKAPASFWAPVCRSSGQSQLPCQVGLLETGIF